MIVYHIESYGSVCCPKDPKWKIKPFLDECISSFEKNENIKLGDTYKKITGKEGEHTIYFTLSNINTRQKLEFLQEIKQYPFKNKHVKNIEFSQQIFMPFLVKKNGLELIHK